MSHKDLIDRMLQGESAEDIVNELIVDIGTPPANKKRKPASASKADSNVTKPKPGTPGWRTD